MYLISFIILSTHLTIISLQYTLYQNKWIQSVHGECLEGIIKDMQVETRWGAMKVNLLFHFKEFLLREPIVLTKYPLGPEH